MQGESSILAEQSCISCRRLKRKCSKKLPTCSLCARVGRVCEYPTLTPIEHRSPASPVGRIRRLEQTPPATTTPSPSLLSEHPGRSPFRAPYTPRADTGTSGALTRSFLDSVATRGFESMLPKPFLWSSVVNELDPPSLTDAHAITAAYFTSVHEWFPVVSHRRLTRHLRSCQNADAVDLAALLFAMHMVSEPAASKAQAFYGPVKAALAACDHQARFSTDYLAAYILVAMYELGQGLFPAAYLTVGHCSRMFLALGLHDKKKATQLFGRLDTWTEVEERRRLWWAVVIMDRYVHVGFRFRPLSIASIAPDELIPGNDELWDQGELAVNPLLVMSIEAATTVSPFARTCQAAHLLGRVCQHVNEHPSSNDADLHFQEAHQLARALSALKAMILQESSSAAKPNTLSTATALCYSALLLLYDVHSCVEVDHVESGGGNRGLRLDIQQLAIDGSKSEAAEVVAFAKTLEQSFDSSEATSVTSFSLHCLYSAAGTYAWYHRETGTNQHLHSLEELRRVLRSLQRHWRVAEDYLALLQNTEFTYSGATFQ